MTEMKPTVLLTPSDDPNEPGTFRFTFDQETIRPSIAVVMALSEVVDTDPIELDPPIGEIIDTDALDGLVRDRQGLREEIRITFRHIGHSITVLSSGVIRLAPLRENNRNDEVTHT